MAHLSMRSARLREALRVASALAFLGLAAVPSWAADPVEPRTWWIEIGGGAAKVHQFGVLTPDSAPATADDVGGFFELGFGHMVNDHLGVGLEVGMSSIRAGGSGENAIQFFSGLVTGRIYPLERSPFHIRLAGGSVVRSDRYTPGQTPQHLGWEAGIGYDLKLRGYNHLTPFVVYQSGRPGGVTTRTVLVGAAYGRW